jgi:hypothetical protein
MRMQRTMSPSSCRGLRRVGVVLAISVWIAALLVVLDTSAAEERSMIAIRSIDEQMSGIRANNPAVKLSVIQDAALEGDRALSMEYPPASGPTSRDVWCDAVEQDWTRGRALSFKAKSDEPI